MTTTPNATLRAVRMGLLMSQDDFARALREAGDRAGVPNDANKRLVQRWEAGDITSPRPAYARALETVTGLPIGSLGFTIAVPRASASERGSGDASSSDGAGDGAGDEPGRPAPGTPAAVAMPKPGAGPVPNGGPASHPAPTGNYSGVWLSRYEFHSSGRGDTFIGRHHVVLLQHGDRLTARSLPGSSSSSLTLDLTVDGNVVTGTWVEQTAPDGYYRGARYHGAIQLLAEPTGRRLAGKWIGFGKDMDVNAGPWELIFRDASTNKATLARYDRPPEPE